MANRYANLVGSNKIKDEWQKINTGFDLVQADMDEKPDKSIAQVNDIAFDADDTLTIEGGTGIAVTTNPNNKKVTITATGTSTPGAHGSSHTEFGADPIPNATTTEGGLMSAADKTRLDGAMLKTADSDLNMNGRSVRNVAKMNIGGFETCIIENNAITPTKSYVTVDTSGGAGELHTINGGSVGDILILRCNSSSRPVTIKHSVGNIIINDGLDVLLNDGHQVYILAYSGTVWRVLGNVGVKRSGDSMTGRLQINNQLYYGTGSPQGNLTASPGSIYQNLSGGTGTTLYYKASGNGNTGWVAIA